MKRLALLALAVAFAACQKTAAPEVSTAPPETSSSAGAMAEAKDLPQRVAQLPRTVIDYDHSLLNDNERQVVDKLIEASKQIDEIFWRQVAEENPQWRT